ncbi:hypothetical protein O0544_14105 [Edwardsiella anguillarum]|nr:hypothetical protein [Edwardsiella anguillarum]
MLTAIYSGFRGSMRWALMPAYRGHGDYTLLFTVVFFFGMSLVRSMAWEKWIAGIMYLLIFLC